MDTRLSQLKRRLFAGDFSAAAPYLNELTRSSGKVQFSILPAVLNALVIHASKTELAVVDGEQQKYRTKANEALHVDLSESLGLALGTGTVWLSPLGIGAAYDFLAAQQLVGSREWREDCQAFTAQAAAVLGGMETAYSWGETCKGMDRRENKFTPKLSLDLGDVQAAAEESKTFTITIKPRA